MSAIKVDIWSDIACPWCYIGLRRFQAAVDVDDVDVDVEFHSFDLAPDTPVDFDGSEVDFLAGHKGMPVAQVEQMLEQMTLLAATEGLTYDFDAVRHTKTLAAHELLHHAKAHGTQLELKERLFAAYFTEGRHIGHTEELLALAADVGLDPEAARAALEDGRYRDEVQADIAQARAYGITGVPFFVVDGRYGVAGAQESAVFRQVLAQAAADRASAERPAPAPAPDEAATAVASA
nr:DsbA family oxidoreductase [Beutenbergia cavernae]